jgi:hypothetical protein
LAAGGLQSLLEQGLRLGIRRTAREQHPCF